MIKNNVSYLNIMVGIDKIHTNQTVNWRISRRLRSKWEDGQSLFC